MKKGAQALIGIVMGSDSDLPTMQAAAETCADFGVAADMRVVSAHRTPVDMVKYAQNAHRIGLKVIIAGAGGAAHLPGMIASLTPLPVIGVPVQSKALNGMDSLLSIVQMPAGVPVATVAIGNARNAALLALRILAVHDDKLREKLVAFAADMARKARDSNLSIKKAPPVARAGDVAS